MLKNPKLIKLGVKLAVGFVGSALIGYVIKGEKAIESMVDAHYAEPTEEQPED